MFTKQCYSHYTEGEYSRCTSMYRDLKITKVQAVQKCIYVCAVSFVPVWAEPWRDWTSLQTALHTVHWPSHQLCNHKTILTACQWKCLLKSYESYWMNTYSFAIWQSYMYKLKKLLNLSLTQYLASVQIIIMVNKVVGYWTHCIQWCIQWLPAHGCYVAWSWRHQFQGSNYIPKYNGCNKLCVYV